MCSWMKPKKPLSLTITGRSSNQEQVLFFLRFVGFLDEGFGGDGMIRAQEKAVRLNDCVAIITGPHIGRVGRFKGVVKGGKVLVSLDSCSSGICTRVRVYPSEIRPVDGQNRTQNG